MRASEGRFRSYAVVRDPRARGRLEQVFGAAPDRELVGVSRDARAAFPTILDARVQSVYVEVDVPRARELITRLRRSWDGRMRAFWTARERRVCGGVPVVPFDDVVAVLESMYVWTERAPLSLDFQNLVLDTLYARPPQEGFVILAYDGRVVFYGPRAARAGGLPYPPPAGLSEADVDHLVGRAIRRDEVRSDNGRVLAERFWIRAPGGR